jgi:hypothetical protein
MSYCRWDYDCDVYVYEHVDGGWAIEVSAPRDALLQNELKFREDTPEKCADRLEALKVKGYQVPQHVIARLRDERAREARAKEELRVLENRNDAAAKSAWLSSIKWTPAWWIRYRRRRNMKKLAKIGGQWIKGHMERGIQRNGFVRKILEPFAKEDEKT